MNGFLEKFWLIFEPVLCSLILENMDAVIGEYLPSFIESVRLTTLTLGTKPFRIESVKTYLNQEVDTVCMDWRVSFTPNDCRDLAAEELNRRVNPKIAISIHLAKNMMGLVIPVQVEDVSFTGKMRVKIRFMDKFPYAKVIDACFLYKPDFDFTLKPFGTDSFGLDVNIASLTNFVREQAHAILGPMMYAPNTFTFDVEKFFAGEMDISQANGILAVRVWSTSSLEDNVNTGNGPFATSPKNTLHPYVRFTVDSGDTIELGRTEVRRNTFQPVWNEIRFLLVNNLNGLLSLELNTKVDNGEDERIATAYYLLRELDDDDQTKQEGLELPLLHKGNAIGNIKVDMQYFAVSKPIRNADGTVEPAPESNSAVLRLTVHECHGLPESSTSSPYARVIVNGREIMTTSVAWDKQHPVYEKSAETVVLEKSEVFVRVEVKNRSKVHHDTVIGVWTSSLAEILEKQEKNEGWWPLAMDNSSAGTLRFSAQWKPVIMNNLLQSNVHSYDTPPIGVMRFSFWEARDLRNVETVGSGKSDPYVRVLSGFQIRERTSVVDNSLYPEWGETLYVPVHSTKEDFVFEVVDWNARVPDKSIGVIDFKTKDLVKLCIGDQSEDPDKWYISTGRNWTRLHSADRRPTKGELLFTAEFYPTLALPRARPTRLPLPPNAEENYIKYTPDDLVDLGSYSSGVLRIKIHEVVLPQNTYAYCQVMADSAYPQFKTSRVRGKTLVFNETADVFVKEVDISRLAIEIKPAAASEKDDRKIGYWLDGVKAIIRHIQDTKRLYGVEQEWSMDADSGAWFDLYGDNAGRIKLSFDYCPMSSFVLNPDESMDNQGNLTVTLLRANNLMAADKSGTSDPYVIFTVNGESVYESSHINKTLNPVWKNEQFTVPIQSRVTASFRIEVFDWNKFQNREPIGSGGITLRGDMVESFMAKNVAIPLDGIAGVSGEVIVRLLWQPQLLTRRKTQTAVLTSTTRIGTSISMMDPAGRSKTGMAGGDVRRSRTESESGLLRLPILDEDEDIDCATDKDPLSDTMGAVGTLKITLIEARGLRGVDKSGTSDPYDPTPVRFKVKDHNQFSRAVTLGSCHYNVWDLIQPRDKHVERWLGLSPMGSGELHISLEFATG
ncbi:C2 domain-containing protein [Dichotomocladium elegans]|nr:C2 domain-containing protein [Dichotomocladium elegans]